jgi:hypothetical protein
MKNVEKTFFLHIPKTAGTSLRGFLEGLFHQTNTSDAWFVDDLLKIPPWKQSNAKLIAGHFPTSIFKWLSLDQYRTITFLRDPLARSISHFNHLKTNEDAYMHAVAKDCDLDTFLQRDDGLFELANIQTRYLGASDLSSEYFFDRSVITREEAESWIYGNRIQKTFRSAIEVLENCDVTGIVERMEDSMLLLAARFVLSNRLSIGHANRGKLPLPSISEQTLGLLREINQYDFKLYAEALRILSQRISEITPESIENSYSRRLASMPKVASWHYTPEDSAFAYGWHGRELIEGGEWARWSAAESAYIDIPCLLPAANYIISFRAGFYTREQLESFRFSINGEHLLLESVRCDDKNEMQKIFRCRVEGKLLYKNTGYIRLGWEVNTLVNPEKQFGENDNRDLGVYLWWCSIDKTCPPLTQSSQLKSGMI